MVVLGGSEAPGGVAHRPTSAVIRGKFYDCFGDGFDFPAIEDQAQSVFAYHASKFGFGRTYEEHRPANGEDAVEFAREYIMLAARAQGHQVKIGERQGCLQPAARLGGAKLNVVQPETCRLRGECVSLRSFPDEDKHDLGGVA